MAQLSGHAGVGGGADEAEAAVAGRAAVGVDLRQVDPVGLGVAEIGDPVGIGRSRRAVADGGEDEAIGAAAARSADPVRQPAVRVLAALLPTRVSA